MKILNEIQLVCNQTQKALEQVVKTLQMAIVGEDRIDQLERELMPVLMNLGRACLEDFVSAAGDGNLGKQLIQAEQTLKRSLTKHTRHYRSIFGVVKIQRYVYALREKTKALATPLDQRLGLPAVEVSYVLQDWLTNLSVHMPYQSAVDWFEKTLGVSLSSTTAWRCIGRLGQHVEEFNEQRAPVAAENEEEILVVLADGKGVPIRRSLESRLEAELGIKPHKRSYVDRYEKSDRRSAVGDKNVSTQRATAGACYSIKPHRRTAHQLLAGENTNAPQPCNKRLWGELTVIGEAGLSRGAERVFESLAEEVKSRDAAQQKTLVCLMDGDRGLWNLQQAHFPQAVCIVDLYHVTEKLWKAAHCFHRDASVEAEKFVARYLRMLLEGKVDHVRGVFQRFLNQKKLTPTKHTNLSEVVTYFRTNRQRMRYDQYLAAGYPVGSGVIEGACKHVVGDRLCGTGMRWEIEGSQPMLDLRVTQLNGEWNQFINYQIKTEQAQLYQQAA